jgi:hypothetical protein
LLKYKDSISHYQQHFSCSTIFFNLAFVIIESKKEANIKIGCSPTKDIWLELPERNELKKYKNTKDQKHQKDKSNN